MQGASVLAQTLSQISRKGSGRNERDSILEYEIVKCLRILFNNSVRLLLLQGRTSRVTHVTVCCERSLISPSSGRFNSFMSEHTTHTLSEMHS